MMTPVKLTLAEYLDAFSAYTSRIVCDLSHQKRCFNCGRRLQVLVAKLWVHQLDQDCANTGHYILVPIPYCCQCERAPEALGCIHLPRPPQSIQRLLGE